MKTVNGTPAPSYDEMEGMAPGAFAFAEDDRGLIYSCPCGCGIDGFIPLKKMQGHHGPVWGWDGNREKPTLTPSIRRLDGCRWHGFLTAGIWQFCGDSGTGSP